MKLDDKEAVLCALQEMRQAGWRAHHAAGEEGGLTGAVRDLLFGLNSAVDALVGMIENDGPAEAVEPPPRLQVWIEQPPTMWVPSSWSLGTPFDDG